MPRLSLDIKKFGPEMLRNIVGKLLTCAIMIQGGCFTACSGRACGTGVAPQHHVLKVKRSGAGTPEEAVVLSLEILSFWKGQEGECAEAAELYRSRAEQREWLLGDIDETVLETDSRKGIVCREKGVHWRQQVAKRR